MTKPPITRTGHPHIHCGDCGKLIPAEKTHNGICSCWLGHCCGFGQATYSKDDVVMVINKDISQ